MDRKSLNYFLLFDHVIRVVVPELILNDKHDYFSFKFFNLRMRMLQDVRVLFMGSFANNTQEFRWL